MFEVLAKLWNVWGVSKALKCVKKILPSATIAGQHGHRIVTQCGPHRWRIKSEKRKWGSGTKTSMNGLINQTSWEVTASVDQHMRVTKYNCFWRFNVLAELWNVWTVSMHLKSFTCYQSFGMFELLACIWKVSRVSKALTCFTKCLTR